MHPKFLLVTLCLPLLLCSCVSMSPSEKTVLRELDDYGIERESEGMNGKWTAGLLNLLPGIGNFYLDQMMLFGVNLFTWPASMIWGIPQAYIDAGRMNQKETARYYTSSHGQERLRNLSRLTR